ncbi:hypothetical protein BC567DRAFT_219098 [Phyllosticta citribraziliensis]
MSDPHVRRVGTSTTTTTANIPVLSCNQFNSSPDRPPALPSRPAMRKPQPSNGHYARKTDARARSRRES